MISLYSNLSANSSARILSGHYNNLRTSTERLSSGLRINGAADDAAGLAIRELMRSDIAALHQGVRNANDAISLLQTMDGALGVIDEKLIRMKELAEQAATGTYDSTQRLMIDSEFQAMGSEIDRIAHATDFNGIKLLCAKMISWFEDEDQFVVTDPGSISNKTLPAGINGNPVLKGIDSAKYIDKNNPEKTINVSLTANQTTKEYTGTLGTPVVNNNKTEYLLPGSPYKVAYINTIGQPQSPVIKYNAANAQKWDIQDAGANRFNPPQVDVNDPTILTAFRGNPMTGIDFSMEDNNGLIDFNNIDSDLLNLEVNTKNNTFYVKKNVIEINDDTADYTASYNEDTQTVTVKLKKGGTATLKLDNALAAGDTVSFDINLEGEVQTVPVEKFGVDPNQKLTIHFGPMNDSAEDYYDINYANCTREGLGLADVDIQTQDKAQNALVQINDAIVNKDKVRAYFGSMQNRLENTMTNLSIQAENLQAAESRISDADIAQEMMTFVRNQILTQSAVAMLAQANSMPQMVMSLIH